MKKVRISRQGLTECPNCRQYIKVEEDLSATKCPFCDASLIAALEDGRNIQLPGTSMMAASLLSLGLAVASCEDGRQMVQPVYGAPSPPADTGVNTPDAEEQSDSGTSDTDASIIMDAATPQDAGVTPDAGQVAEDSGTELDAGLLDSGSDIKDAKPKVDMGTPIPPYGIPPPRDAGQRDAATIIDAEADATTPPVPLYGLPPRPDASPVPTDAGVNEDAKVDSGPAVTPLYGLPPPSRDAQ